jgi:hypothetical protein
MRFQLRQGIDWLLVMIAIGCALCSTTGFWAGYHQGVRVTKNKIPVVMPAVKHPSPKPDIISQTFREAEVKVREGCATSIFWYWQGNEKRLGVCYIKPEQLDTRGTRIRDNER